MCTCSYVSGFAARCNCVRCARLRFPRENIQNRSQAFERVCDKDSSNRARALHLHRRSVLARAVSRSTKVTANAEGSCYIIGKRVAGPRQIGRESGFSDEKILSLLICYRKQGLKP